VILQAHKKFEIAEN